DTALVGLGRRDVVLPGEQERGVLVQPLAQLLDILLLFPDLGPQLSHLGLQRHDEGAGFGRQAVPYISRQWRPGAHSADIAGGPPGGLRWRVSATQRIGCGGAEPARLVGRARPRADRPAGVRDRRGGGGRARGPRLPALVFAQADARKAVGACTSVIPDP